MDILKWIKNSLIDDYVGKPITIDMKIEDLSDKYDVGVIITLSVIPKTKKED